MRNDLAVVVTAALLCSLVSSADPLALMPGVEARASSALDAEFSANVEAVMDELRRGGHHPVLAAAYRDAERQEAIFVLGRILELFGARRITNARGGHSCHNHRDADGAPASLAADIVPGPSARGPAAKADFFHALGKAAARHGLRWGGAWARSNPTWRKYQLGWDPGHVQARKCRW